MCSLFYLFNDDVSSSDDCNEPPLAVQPSSELSPHAATHFKEGLLVLETEEERAAELTLDVDQSPRRLEQIDQNSLTAAAPVDQHDGALPHVCQELAQTDQHDLHPTKTNHLLSEHQAAPITDSQHGQPDLMSLEEASTPILDVFSKRKASHDPLLQRKSSHLSSPADQLSLAQAEEEMRNLIMCFSKENVHTNILLNRDCPIASSMRGLLLGRNKHVGATWEELWIARVEHQVPLSSIMFDDLTGSVCGVTYKPSVEALIPVQEAIDRLTKSTEVIAQNLCPVLRMKLLHIDGTIRSKVVPRMFGLDRITSPVLFSKHSLDFDSHYRLIHKCLEYAVHQRYCRNVDASRARSAMLNENKELPVLSSVNLNETTKEFGTFWL